MDKEKLRIKLELLEKFGEPIMGLKLGELAVLNEIVAERYSLVEMEMLRKAKSIFHPGHHVKWEHEGVKYLGKIQKLNKKTISVIELSAPHRKWNIYPEYLTVVPRG